MVVENGRVELAYEQPLVIMRMKGTPTGAEVVRSMVDSAKATEHWPFAVTIVDLSEQKESLSSEGRKMVADAPPSKVPSRGTALFGASFAMRTLATLLINVMNITQKNNNPSKFFTTESEARAWALERAQQSA